MVESSWKTSPLSSFRMNLVLSMYLIALLSAPGSSVANLFRTCPAMKERFRTRGRKPLVDLGEELATILARDVDQDPGSIEAWAVETSLLTLEIGVAFTQCRGVDRDYCDVPTDRGGRGIGNLKIEVSPGLETVACAGRDGLLLLRGRRMSPLLVESGRRMKSQGDVLLDVLKSKFKDKVDGWGIGQLFDGIELIFAQFVKGIQEVFNVVVEKCADVCEKVGTESTGIEILDEVVQFCRNCRVNLSAICVNLEQVDCNGDDYAVLTINAELSPSAFPSNLLSSIPSEMPHTELKCGNNAEFVNNECHCKEGFFSDDPESGCETCFDRCFNGDYCTADVLEESETCTCNERHPPIPFNTTLYDRCCSESGVIVWENACCPIGWSICCGLSVDQCIEKLDPCSDGDTADPCCSCPAGSFCFDESCIDLSSSVMHFLLFLVRLPDTLMPEKISWFNLCTVTILLSSLNLGRFYFNTI